MPQFCCCSSTPSSAKRWRPWRSPALGELPLAERAAFDFLIPAGADSDDDSTAEMRAFLHALYLAWRLDVRLLLDV